MRFDWLESAGFPLRASLPWLVARWAEGSSRFTLLFERFAIDVLQATQTIKGAMGILNLKWDATWNILERAVKRGKARKTNSPLPRIGIDEKAFLKGQSYVSMIYDLDNSTVEAISNGNDYGHMFARVHNLIGPLLQNACTAHLACFSIVLGNFDRRSQSSWAWSFLCTGSLGTLHFDILRDIFCCYGNGIQNWIATNFPGRFDLLKGAASPMVAVLSSSFSKVDIVIENTGFSPLPQKNPISPLAAKCCFLRQSFRLRDGDRIDVFVGSWGTMTCRSKKRVGNAKAP